MVLKRSEVHCLLNEAKNIEVVNRVNTDDTSSTGMQLLNRHKYSSNYPDPLKRSGIKHAGSDCEKPVKGVGAGGTKDGPPSKTVEK